MAKQSASLATSTGTPSSAWRSAAIVRWWMQGMLAQVSSCVSGSTTPAMEIDSSVGVPPASAMKVRSVSTKAPKSSRGVGRRPSGVISVSERATPPLIAEPPMSKEMIIRILLVPNG